MQSSSIEAASRGANRTLVLLMLSVGINYIDRGALSVSAPVLARELALSPAQLGLLFSGFFWTYSVLQPVAGWLIDRYSLKALFSGGYLIWSLATCSVAGLHRFGSIFTARLALGIGESVAYPAYSRILVQQFPEHRRGLANSLLEASAKAGPALSTFAGALLVVRYGWRVLFLCLGLTSLAWLVPWFFWGPTTPRANPKEPKSSVSLRQIVSRREAWGTSLGMFAFGYVWSFLLSWLPVYLVNERGFSLESVSVLGSLPLWAMAGTSVLGGWLSDRWIASGRPVTVVRKGFIYAGLLACGGTLVTSAAVREPRLSVLLLIVSCAALGLFTSNVWAVTQTLAGTAAAGSWTGIQNAVGNLGGAVSPYVTGVIIGHTGSAYLAFATCSAVLLAGIVCYALLITEVRPLEWDTPRVASHFLRHPL